MVMSEISLFTQSTERIKKGLEDVNLNDDIELNLKTKMNILKKGHGVKRCMFCGHEVSGDHNDRCPFCGVSSSFLVNPTEYFGHNIPVLTDDEKTDILFTLDLEIVNMVYYEMARDQTDSVEWKTYFRYLARQEEHHAEEIGEIIDISEPSKEDLNQMSLKKLPKDIRSQFIESIAIENEAIAFYKKAFERAENPTLRSMYQGLIEAEEYHNDILYNLVILNDNRK
jgi:rubrerythrin